MYALVSFFSISLLLIKLSRFIQSLFYSSLALWIFSSAKSCVLRSYSPWSVSMLKRIFVLLKANVYTKAPPILNNNDAIYFLRKMIRNQPPPLHPPPPPTVKSMMTSFSWLCFFVSIFRLSCRTAGITILGHGGGKFLWSLFISLFESIFMPVLPTKILLLYPFLRSMYITLPTEKSTFDNAWSNTPWCFSISMSIE